MRIVEIRTRNIGYSRAPETLRRNVVSNATLLEDFTTKPGGWFGQSFATLVEVVSDEGLVGVGTAGAFHGGGKAIVDDYLADLVLDQDPRHHEALWQRMYRATARFARSGSPLAAIAAVDIACWDLHGKAEDRPVYELLGGPTRSTAPVYASRLYALEDLEELAREAKGYVEQGFVRMKQRFGFGPSDGPEGMRRNVELIRTVREAVGDDVELAADAYLGWDLGYTIEMAQRLRDLNLAWLEEPLMPHDIDGYAELTRRVPWQRFSFGEHLYSKWEFGEVIRRRASDVLQPDTNRAGGITEVRKICAMAEAAGLPVIPHSNEAHNLHITFSQPASVCPVVEYFPDVEPDTGNELFWKLFSGNPRAVGGQLEPPSGPGLGIAVDEDVASDLQVSETTVRRRS